MTTFWRNKNYTEEIDEKIFFSTISFPIWILLNSSEKTLLIDQKHFIFKWKNKMFFSTISFPFWIVLNSSKNQNIFYLSEKRWYSLQQIQMRFYRNIHYSYKNVFNSPQKVLTSYKTFNIFQKSIYFYLNSAFFIIGWNERKKIILQCFKTSAVIKSLI